LSNVFYKFDDKSVTIIVKRRWTKKEIDFLKQYYNSHGAKYCAQHLYCCPRRVRIKASRLGIIITSNVKSKVCKKCYLPKPLTDFSPHSKAKKGVQPRCKLCRAKWESNRKRTDKTYRIVHGIRNRIRIAIKKNVKSSSSLILLGCTIPFLKQYLATKFQKGMSWENYGHWHIDHIQPCSSFDLSIPEQQRQCFHYTNLQPLWAKDNLVKSNKCKYKRKT
jgi:hypothetical protein